MRKSFSGHLVIKILHRQGTEANAEGMQIRRAEVKRQASKESGEGGFLYMRSERGFN